MAIDILKKNARTEKEISNEKKTREIERKVTKYLKKTVRKEHKKVG